jgi:hypothetical protein
MLHRLVENFPWLRTAAELARLTGFLTFAGLGLRIVWLERRRQQTQRAISQFIIYALVVSCLTGFTQIEAWPFTTWALVHHVSQKNMVDWKLEAVTASGQAYPIDPRFIEPLPYEDFDTWLKTKFLALGLTEEEIKAGRPHAITPEQARAAQFLIARLESSRRRFRGGGSPGTSSWLLGRFSAPYHFDRPPVWRSAGDTPDTPFVGLRIWELHWDVEQRYQDESRVERRLIFHYRS